MGAALFGSVPAYLLLPAHALAIASGVAIGLPWLLLLAVAPICYVVGLVLFVVAVSRRGPSRPRVTRMPGWLLWGAFLVLCVEYYVTH